MKDELKNPDTLPSVDSALETANKTECLSDEAIMGMIEDLTRNKIASLELKARGEKSNGHDSVARRALANIYRCIATKENIPYPEDNLLPIFATAFENHEGMVMTIINGRLNADPIFYQNLIEAQIQAILTDAKKTLEAFRRENELARDPLTGLPRRKSTMDFINTTFARRSLSVEGKNGAFIFLDLDHFKHINDTYGHPSGDVVLRAFAKFLKETFRPGDFVARFGGEEFLVFIPETDFGKLNATVERIYNAMQKFESELLDQNGQKVKITFSAGARLFSYKDCLDPATLIDQADKALYQAKGNGRNRVDLWGEGKNGEANFRNLQSEWDFFKNESFR